MMLIQVLFYLFSGIAVFSALMVVASSNPVRSVLFLVLTFVAMSSLWMMLHAEFLALILVLVYVGAVMTLFLFVVMMLQIKLEDIRKHFVRYLPLGALLVLCILGMTVMVIGPSNLGLAVMPIPAEKAADYSNTADLGSVLYTDYAYPFEIAAVLLLTAIVAAISLTHRKSEGRKSQNIERQVAVRREDRVRLIKMKSEKRGDA